MIAVPVVIGPGPIGLLAVAVAKSLGASPVILVGTRENRNEIGRQLGADYVIDGRKEDVVARVMEITGKGADYVMDCAGNETTVNDAVHMTNRGGKVCLAAFPKNPVNFDLGYLAVNNIYLYGTGNIKIRATYESNGKEIIINSIPYQANTTKIIEQIQEQILLKQQVQLLYKVRKQVQHLLELLLHQQQHKEITLHSWRQLLMCSLALLVKLI